jgi:uncharacterized protein
MPTIEQARAWYADLDAVHDFSHILRVYTLAERLAQAEGADLEIVRAAALLHDAAGSSPGGKERADHHLLSAEFAAQVLSAEGWDDTRIASVQHCIRGHRFRSREDRPQTIEARVLFDADKLDVLGAIGVARTIAYAALNNQPIYAEPSPHFLDTGKTLPGEPHSSYHEYLFKLSKVKSRLFTRSALLLAEDRAAYMDGFYAQLAAETRGER